MAKIQGSKCKLCRRAGEKLFLKGERCASPKCALVRKSYPPGVHGKSGGVKGLSEFGKQLKEKQKLKRIYGISERQLRRYLEIARKKRGVLGDNLLTVLENRLDNIVYRLGMADSRTQARQLVSHSLFQVNGRPLNIPSALLKIGDVVAVKDTKKEKKYFKELQAVLKKDLPKISWLDFNPEKMEGKVVANPNKDEIGFKVDMAMVIEFYSR